MIGTPNKSPIDTLLKKNTKMAESSQNAARRSNTNAKSKSEFLMPRSKRFGKNQTTYLRSRELDDEREISQIQDSLEAKSSTSGQTRTITERHEDLVKKEKLLERLRYLGLAPHKYAAKKSASSSSNKRKSQTPRRVYTLDDSSFIQPFVFECGYCPKLFFHKRVYRRHMIKHLNVQRCMHCSKPFKCTLNLRRHKAQCKRIIY